MEDILKGLGKLIAGVLVMALIFGVIGYCTSGSSEDEYNGNDGSGSSGRNVNFGQSYQSKYGGNPCSHQDYSGSLTCSEKGDCYGGFSSSNREPSKCANCGHSYSYHK